MKLKLTPADKKFSNCVRERSNWTCDYNGTVFAEAQITKKTKGLHCSHWKGRGNWAVRFEPLNAFSHSYGSHQLLGSNQDGKFDRWVEEFLGKERKEIVEELAQCTKRGREYRKANKGRGKNNALLEHYTKELDRMIEMRNDGYQGRIDFVAFI